MFVLGEMFAGGARNIAAARLTGAVGRSLYIFLWLVSTAVFCYLFIRRFICSHRNRSFRKNNVCGNAYIYKNKKSGRISL